MSVAILPEMLNLPPNGVVWALLYPAFMVFIRSVSANCARKTASITKARNPVHVSVGLFPREAHSGWPLGNSFRPVGPERGGMNSALPGEASLRRIARGFPGVLHSRKFHQIEKTSHRIAPTSISTQFRPSSSLFRLQLSQFSPALKPFSLASEPFGFGANAVCSAANKICLAFF